MVSVDIIVIHISDDVRQAPYRRAKDRIGVNATHGRKVGGVGREQVVVVLGCGDSGRWRVSSRILIFQDERNVATATATATAEGVNSFV